MAMTIPDVWRDPDRPPPVTAPGWPRLIAFELRDGKYEQIADVSVDEQFLASLPFLVVIRPSALVRVGPLD